ncbi:Zinc-type alcohol dehydrogenase-like protein [Streptomyces sp. YIM 121038]|uniref:NADP-dependent oxidoreductase n=1 Tax=Streptomyces sp. YIM 121038 TaxID=2136401 RepID=UPI0011105581|nr:NADP-dependent oxidoreductase [Streptomyces sp. YIM 121038]QCX80158.1 Zinc-type alcohol dehydrogenase-like protein [Streptomyces sp. YIM 121038]
MAKAYVYTRHGGPEVEALIDREPPRPGPGQLLVAVRAAGVNPVDHKLRGGYRRPGQAPAELPEVLGSEAAGVVAEVGPGVTGFAVGDPVFGSTLTGGYAEYTLLPVAVAAHKPQGLSFAEAAALPVAAATAYDGVRQLALPAGATLLVTGVGGGVGGFVARLAVHEGLRVIGTASDGKKEYVESLGVTHVAPGPDLVERIRALAPDGVDGVFDLVGGEHLRTVAELVADRTKLITAGGKGIVGELGGSPVARARTAEVLDAVAALAAADVLRPHITAVYPLPRAGEALRSVESGHARGKVVIEVGR